MACARCGCGIYKTEEFISLNKVWHKYCFNCYQCNKRLDRDTAKIFQGELFCETCYANVIEKLFEVISTPSLTRPCKVASTPSCVAAKKNCFEEKTYCESTFKNWSPCDQKEYCFPAEKKLNQCIQRSVQSCSCIPSGGNGAKDEYCFVFPIPREVANYYNRAHMKNKACTDPTISCTQQPAQGTSTGCSCRNPCCPPPKCQVQVRTLKNQQCCCGSPPSPRCRNPSPCCCYSLSSQPSPTCSPLVLKRPSGCCPSPQKPIVCCDPCSPNDRCAPCKLSPPCQRCSCCQKKTPPTCKAKQCPPCCQPPPQYCLPPARCVLPPRCSLPKPQCSSPSPLQCCSRKTEGCCCCTRCEQSSSEQNSKSRRCCYQKTPKYCICGNVSPCNCKMSQIKTQCTVCCVRCGQKVYVAEKILVSSGAFHTSCFTCFCCKKCLDVKNVCEGRGEIYCKHCYNHFFGVEYYGFGGKNC